MRFLTQHERRQHLHRLRINFRNNICKHIGCDHFLNRVERIIGGEQFHQFIRHALSR